MSKQEEKEVNPFYKLKLKVQKKYGAFTDSVDGLSIEDLKKNFVIYCNHREDTSNAKKNDPDLKNAKELVSELSGPYNDNLSALNDKISYIHALLVEKKTDE